MILNQQKRNLSSYARSMCDEVSIYKNLTFDYRLVMQGIEIILYIEINFCF